MRSRSTPGSPSGEAAISGRQRGRGEAGGEGRSGRGGLRRGGEGPAPPWTRPSPQDTCRAGSPQATFSATGQQLPRPGDADGTLGERGHPAVPSSSALGVFKPYVMLTSWRVPVSKSSGCCTNDQLGASATGSTLTLWRPELHTQGIAGAPAA